MRLGVLDIGSNTVHLLLVDAYPGARPVPFASHKRPLSLVQYLDADGAINEAGQAELLDFVHEAAQFAINHHAEDLLAFCTSAIRESANGEEVLERVISKSGTQRLPCFRHCSACSLLKWSSISGSTRALCLCSGRCSAWRGRFCGAWTAGNAASLKSMHNKNKQEGRTLWKKKSVRAAAWR